MKKLILVVAALLAPSAVMASGQSGEVGYAKGSLGYDALIAGENEKALEQILASDVKMTDPAKLINLGTVYARLGRMGDAAKAFQAAVDCKNHGDLELADGSIMNSREAAYLSLEKVQSRTAMR
ncbi:MAG: hypothetical protein HC843_03950 [Sphingomonadales bacterium]|nr:hypothetical protein [Sphingomonadales bacterium]